MVNPRCSMFFSSQEISTEIPQEIPTEISTRNPTRNSNRKSQQKFHKKFHTDSPQEIPNHPRFLYLNSSRLLVLLGEDDLHIDKEEVPYGATWSHGGRSRENMVGELPCLLVLPINNMANIVIHSLRLVKHVYY